MYLCSIKKKNGPQVTKHWAFDQFVYLIISGLRACLLTVAAPKSKMTTKNDYCTVVNLATILEYIETVRGYNYRYSIVSSVSMIEKLLVRREVVVFKNHVYNCFQGAYCIQGKLEVNILTLEFQKVGNCCGV